MSPSRAAGPGSTARTGPLRRDAQANLARILTAAADVFAEHGCNAALADVAKAAEVGVGTVYRTFATKDDLIYVVYEPQFARAEQQALDASLDPDPWAGIAGFLEKSVMTLAPDRGLRELLSGSYSETLGWSRPRTPHRLAKLVEDSHNRTGEHLERLVQRARDAGLVRADLVAGDLLLLSMTVQTSVEFGGPSHPRLYRRMIGFLMDSLQPARAAPTPLPEPGLTNQQIAALERQRRERMSGSPGN
ncbi:TetR/AcrR family transcriptional regulator [Nocardia sp. NBC_00565]|uniref:TetR/AcrR family transcriptional regulator n=1 Tax=Nocardia sp. NBC_00565 TaxID=2975993 RepID=UPI002E824811|nr:TetR/AcrR family transcriptional regulator [Nocardia sp. NBC_00565]WUC03219.1 TetR/AcrR family transcriptional regulator [Nocardia sp. NBC_00565]